jgi:cell wall hydrolase
MPQPCGPRWTGEVTKAGRITRPAGSSYRETLQSSGRRGFVREYGPFAFGGAMLVLAFAFAGHYMGQNAIAHNAVPDEPFDAVVAPTTPLVTKGSLLPDGGSFDLVNLKVLEKQTVVSHGKGDYIFRDPGVAIRIEPAAVELTPKRIESAVQRLAMTPEVAKIEQTFKLKRGEKQKVIALRRTRLAEENCLARAIYFEARSESELGQLAVAKVILNRVKDPDFPKSICGVVYQGSGRRNSCQFSFACDGLADDVRQPAAWSQSKRIAQKALAGDQTVRVIGTATNYHADYVNPKWAKSMKRLIKIGRHIFYSDT